MFNRSPAPSGGLGARRAHENSDGGEHDSAPETKRPESIGPLAFIKACPCSSSAQTAQRVEVGTQERSRSRHSLVATASPQSRLQATSPPCQGPRCLVIRCRRGRGSQVEARVGDVGTLVELRLRADDGAAAVCSGYANRACNVRFPEIKGCTPVCMRSF